MLTSKINWLLNHLPHSPNPILVVGTDLNELIPAITQHHHPVIFAHFSEEHGQNFEEINLINSSENIMLCQNSYTAIVLCIPTRLHCLLTIFNQAHNLLTNNGKVFLMGEVSLEKVAEDTDESPLYITYVIAHIQRCGFQLNQQIELATSPHIKQPHHRLVGLEWVKTIPPRWRIEVVTSQEKEKIVALFNQVFKPNQMSSAFWEWKYGQGRGLGILAWHQNQLIAHYGGILREIRYFGQSKIAVQITDVMVDVKERGVLTRQGAFFLVTATFLENYIGYGARTWVGYGFPSHRHVKLAQHLGLYAAVGEVVELRWPTIVAKPHGWTRVRHLHPQESIKEQQLINQLWDKMSITLCQALVGVRDWPYLYHRYLLHPNKHYELLLISRRFIGQALAVVVIDRDHDTCKIMDFIGDIRFIPLAIYQVRRLAGHWGLRQVHVWITENFITTFPLEQAEQHRLGIYIPHNIWAHSFPPNLIENRWWLMAGDTDFL